MARAPWDVTRDMFLDLDEVDRLLALVRSAAGDGDDPRRFVDRMIVETLLFTGVRCSEFCKLTLADFDPQARRLRVAADRRNERVIWLAADVAELLGRYVRDVRPAFLASPEKHASATPLVVNERGRAYERSGLYRRVVRVLGEAGLGARASVQLLRHTYGYLAYLRTGGNLLFVQRQLGHAHPMITSVYAQFVEEDYADLASRVGGAPDA